MRKDTRKKRRSRWVASELEGYADTEPTLGILGVAVIFSGIMVWAGLTLLSFLVGIFSIPRGPVLVAVTLIYVCGGFIAYIMLVILLYGKSKIKRFIAQWKPVIEALDSDDSNTRQEAVMRLRSRFSQESWEKPEDWKQWWEDLIEERI